MLLTGVFLVVAASEIMGWAGLYSKKIREGGIDISWQLLP
jgi:hypothetical protein